MLEGLILGVALAALPPAPLCPAYLPLPDAPAVAETSPPAPPAEDLPSFPIPLTRLRAPKHASATLWLEVIDDDLPSFPIAVPHQGPEETSTR
jgi:hypothetical protein